MKKQHYIRQQQEKRYQEQVDKLVAKYIFESQNYIITMPDESESFTYTHNGRTYVRLSAEMFKEWRNAMLTLRAAQEILNNEAATKELTQLQKTFCRYITQSMPNIPQFDELCKAYPIW